MESVDAQARFRAVKIGISALVVACIALVGCGRRSEGSTTRVVADPAGDAAPIPARESKVHVFVTERRGCALDDGALSCFAVDDDGAFGSLERMPIDGVLRVTMFDYWTCATTSARKTYCWGHFGIGEPWWDEIEPMADLDGATDVAAPYDAMLWFVRDGRATSIAHPSSVFAKLDMTPLATLDHVAELQANDSVACMLANDGTVACAGMNVEGMIPNIDATAVTTSPVKIDGIVDAKSLSVGSSRVCVLTSKGEVWCWGLSVHDVGAKLDPRASPVKAFDHARAVSAGGRATCIVRDDGRVAITIPSLGKSMPKEKTIVVGGIEGASSVACGEEIGCAVDRDDRVWCWATQRYGGPGLAAGVLAHPLPLEGAAPSKKPIAGPHPLLPLTRDQLGALVMPVPQDAKCWPANLLWDPRAKTCRGYPGGCYNCAAGCSIGGGGGGPPSEGCMTGTIWGGCDCGCASGVFDGNKRTCVPAPPTK